MNAIMPPVRTPASYQILPDGCCCTWAWSTSVEPWQWMRVVAVDGCKATHPGDSGETA